jgi:hypothetical protein
MIDIYTYTLTDYDTGLWSVRHSDVDPIHYAT